ncbi:hypothetical protein EUGRSUZ_A00841 [Eucalyptus grandis]|uniref:Uncharacterized protein n=2 Tax=Eucalyptus grandis TaxID=71139 RepID=A0ACC3M0P8_EUCGR|nr:hypothetical protein EUGRSUZ_A00841 [Eucalyptus grandis]
MARNSPLSIRKVIQLMQWKRRWNLHNLGLTTMKLIVARSRRLALFVNSILVHPSSDAFRKIPCSAKGKILQVAFIHLQPRFLVSKPSPKLCF